jgi:hypothetical protein
MDGTPAYPWAHEPSPLLVHACLPSRGRPHHDQPPYADPTPPTSTSGAWTICPCHCLANLPPHPTPRHNPGGRDRVCRGYPPRSPLPTHIQNMMGPATILNAPKCGSNALRPTCIWQNLLPKEALDESYSNLPVPSRTVDDMLTLVGLGLRKMPPGDTSHPTNTYPIALPRYGTRPSPHTTTGNISPNADERTPRAWRDSHVPLSRSQGSPNGIH